MRPPIGDDVVVELREATRTRLELLAAELAPVFAEVPDDVDLFDFTISSGLQPRLWIDAVSHVSMGRDRRTYRFLRDTRLGRVVLAEVTAIKPVADQVTRYVAERIVERQRLMEGRRRAGCCGPAAPCVAEASRADPAAPGRELVGVPVRSRACRRRRAGRTGCRRSPFLGPPRRDGIWFLARSVARR